MNSFEALLAFAAQLERNIASERFHTKVVITPSPVNERGMVIKVSLLKSYLQAVLPPAARTNRVLRVRVSVAGTAESLTGLEQALDAIEVLDRYLAAANLRLEARPDEGEEVIVPNSRIIQTVSGEDSFFDSLDSTEVQEVQDDRIVTITIPEGVSL